MLLEEQRSLHEDLERLEQAISDRVLEDPKHIRDRLRRDHQISTFLSRIQDQSRRLEDVYNDPDGARTREMQVMATGDPFDEFYKQLGEIKSFHRQYPNEPVENLERAYRRKVLGEGDNGTAEIDNLFTGEEAYGRFFDLTSLHEQYLNLPGIRGGRRLSYLKFLDVFDIFSPPECQIKRIDKLQEQYFQYVSGLTSYLEDFMRRTKPLEDVDKLLANMDDDFAADWDAERVAGWEKHTQVSTTLEPVTEGSGEGLWCGDCEKEFKNQNVYNNHLSGKKHIRAAGTKKEKPKANMFNGHGPNQNGNQASSIQRLKERAVAQREFRVHKLAAAMQTERSDTKVNVERRQGMTERERQQEMEALYAESLDAMGQDREGGSDDEGDDKIYNPLKLPLAWDGKPIPFWLYKLHGLGVEFSCEICGNFVYMGRRAFDKHFNEARHIWGLKCLGITNTTLFREITSIGDAVKLWAKLQQDKKMEKMGSENVVQMEDGDGNVMPEKVYYDLQKQGLV